MPEGHAMPFDPNGAFYWKGKYHLGLRLPEIHRGGHATPRQAAVRVGACRVFAAIHSFGTVATSFHFAMKLLNLILLISVVPALSGRAADVQQLGFKQPLSGTVSASQIGTLTFP